MADDVESASAADLIDRASQALRAIHVEGVFSELADRLDSSAPICPTWCSACPAKWTMRRAWRIWMPSTGASTSWTRLTRRWGPELSDVITWRDKAVYDLEDLDASPEKGRTAWKPNAQLLEAAEKAAQAVSKRRRAAAKELASKSHRGT